MLKMNEKILIDQMDPEDLEMMLSGDGFNTRNYMSNVEVARMVAKSRREAFDRYREQVIIK